MAKTLERNSSPIRNSKSAIRNHPVPFVDLKAQYQSIKGEIDEAIARVIQNTSFILGPEAEAFEQSFAEYVGARFCLGLNSGTAALHLALLAGGIGTGDEVIVPANSFFATAEAVSVTGAKPVFVDADPASYTIDTTKIEQAVTERTRAIIPVHLYGQSADLDPIFEIARSKKLLVIEDAAQAHGAEYKGRRVGALGDIGCFSFYPGKNLGAYGEGGAVVTNDEHLARQVRLLRDHGSEQKYRHEIVGYNFRIEGIQAAVLNVKLRHLDRWNNLRRAHARQYTDLLQDTNLVLPTEMPFARHVYHVYVVQTEARDDLQRALSDAGIQTGIHYPIPIHLQPAYASLGHQPGDFPESERQSQRLLSLPMFAELTDEQIIQVSATAREALPTQS